MTQDTDPWEERKKLTFEQAEGAAPLPQQLQPKEISLELRAVLWRVVYEHLQQHREYSQYAAYPHLIEPWDHILRIVHTFREHRMIDEYSSNADVQIDRVKQIFAEGDYLQIFGWLQYVLREKPPKDFPRLIEYALKHCKAAYRLFDGDTIVPIGTEEEALSVAKAFSNLATSEFHGARAHLKQAAELLTQGKDADSIRESIHAVEAVIRSIEPNNKFSKALAKLSDKADIHGSMKVAFNNLYGYTSDQKGIRHPLLDENDASVDDVDAQFMLGACASFISYLINKARAAGLLG